MSQVRALVWKEVRIHGRTVAIYLVGGPIVIRALMQAQHTMGLTQGQSLASMVVPTAIAFSSMIAIFMAQWLIEPERGKATFAWIRTLPLSDLHVVLGKFVTVVAFCLVGGVAGRLSVAGIDLGVTPWQWLSAWLLWCVFAGIALFFQLLLSGRFAGVTPGLLFFAATGVAFFISRSPAATARVTRGWNDPWTHGALWLTCGAVEAVAIVATYRLFCSRDSHSLVE